jgi:formate--tetrahydrofolate ligase
MQTLEGQPMLVHAGPFANIAIGQSSVIADRLGAALSDYLVTESGFASDIGFEKFWNIKCRCSGLKPDAVVIVATVRALKLHGGGPAVQAGRSLDPVYTSESLDLLEKGCTNLLAHIAIVQRSGVRPVVCLNSFHTDTPAEHALVRRIAEAAGARFAVSQHWLRGGEGALELAEAVVAACEEPNHFAFLSDLAEPLSTRVETIVKSVYGGDGVSYSAEAAAKLAAFEADPAVAQLPVCMAKTQYSLSHDPKLLGRPKGWILPVRDLLLFQGAGLVVPVAGDIKLMPGTASNAAFRRVDIDTATGKVKGLF